MNEIKVRLNYDVNHVKAVLDGIKANGGYCPCAIERTDATRCMCKEFREKLEDDSFHGECHCGLYVKE